MFHAHADYDDGGGVDKDAADEEVLVKVMMEKMICWKMPHPNMMTLRLVIFRNDLARPAVPQEFYLLVNFGPIGPYFRQIVGLESSFKNI